MSFMYLFSLVDDEDISSSIFRSKENALDHIEKTFPEYKKVAEDRSEDIEYWRKQTGEGIVLEKLKVED